MAILDVRQEPSIVTPTSPAGRAVLAPVCPLTVATGSSAVLNCYAAEPHRFTDDEIALFLPGQPDRPGHRKCRLVTKPPWCARCTTIKNNLQTWPCSSTADERRSPDFGAEVLHESVNRILRHCCRPRGALQRGFRLVDLKEVLTRVGRPSPQYAAARAGSRGQRRKEMR